MQYEVFVKQVCAQLRRVLPEDMKDAVIETQLVEKLQDGSYFGLTVRPADSGIGVSMNLTEAFLSMEAGRSFDEVLKGIAEAALLSLEDRPMTDHGMLMDYAKMKERLLIQMVPTQGNEEVLKRYPHRQQGDMSVVYRFILREDETGVESVVVTNSLLDQYGVSPEQLHTDALENAPRHFPVSIRNMKQVLAEMIGIREEELPPSDHEMYVATCNHGEMGAGCICYPGFMEEAAKTTGGDFFLLPSSVHEVILLHDTKRITYQELQKMVHDINETEVLPRDRLSDNVYHYDAKEKVFEMAQTYAERCSPAKRSVYEKLAEKERSIRRQDEAARESKEMER